MINAEEERESSSDRTSRGNINFLTIPSIRVKYGGKVDCLWSRGCNLTNY